jgi:hypothetical protein
MPLSEVVPLLAPASLAATPRTLPASRPDPATPKTKDHGSLAEVAVAGDEDEPVLFIMEDLHWVIPPRWNFSASCSTRCQPRVCVLCTFRPGFHHPGLQAHLTLLTLSRLPPPPDSADDRSASRVASRCQSSAPAIGSQDRWRAPVLWKS